MKPVFSLGEDCAVDGADAGSGADASLRVNPKASPTVDSLAGAGTGVAAGVDAGANVKSDFALCEDSAVGLAPSLGGEKWEVSRVNPSDSPAWDAGAGETKSCFALADASIRGTRLDFSETLGSVTSNFDFSETEDVPPGANSDFSVGADSAELNPNASPTVVEGLDLNCWTPDSPGAAVLKSCTPVAPDSECENSLSAVATLDWGSVRRSDASGSEADSGTKSSVELRGRASDFENSARSLAEESIDVNPNASPTVGVPELNP